MDEQTKTAIELALAILGTIVTWITAFPHIALSSQILLGIILILIDLVILIDWLELPLQEARQESTFRGCEAAEHH